MLDARPHTSDEENVHVSETEDTVAQVTRRFDALRAETLPKGASRDLIMKVAEERWR